MSNNKLILKNTVYLYLRMLLSMAVTLYTSRVVLDALGVVDFGIYNVIGGIVVFFSLINNSMAAATQRFITFELGKGVKQRVSNIFSMSMTIHIIICIVILIVGESLGVYYVSNYLNVPPDRLETTYWLFQISILTLFFNIIRIPYHASIIAYERMNFFAIISILEVILQLLIAFLLYICNIDKLLLYGGLLLIVTSITTLSYKIYCNKCFETCFYHWYFDWTYFRSLTKFFGWNFLGAIGTTGTNQIGNILINYFCGPTINASFGIANRVNTAIAGFTSNFQVAYTPQITKLYSQGKIQDLYCLMLRSALLSYYLLFMVAAPLCFCLENVLSIWLVEVPPYAPAFIFFLIVYNLIDSVQAPLWKVITATGNIKYYEIWLNLLLILNIPLSYFFLKEGYPPYIVVIISTSLNFISAIARTIHVKIMIGLPIKDYLQKVVSRVLIVTIFYVMPSILFKFLVGIEHTWVVVLFYFISIIYISMLIFTIGIPKDDKLVIKISIGKIINKIKN